MSANDDATLGAKRALCLQRLHANLRLIEFHAPADLIAISQRLLDESLEELGLIEPAVWQLYPTYRLLALGRAAIEPPFKAYTDDGAYDDQDEDEDDGGTDNDHLTQGASND